VPDLSVNANRCAGSFARQTNFADGHRRFICAQSRFEPYAKYNITLFLELDEAASYFAPRSLAYEPALLRGAVVVRAHARAALVGGNGCLMEWACGVAVKVTAEDGLKIEFGETPEQIIGVQRSCPDKVSEREMGKEDGGSLRIEPAKIFIEPAKGGSRDAGVRCLGSFTGVETDDLPAALVEGVIDLARKNLLVSGTVGIGEIVVIADDCVTGNAERGEGLFNGGQLRGCAVVGEIAA